MPATIFQKRSLAESVLGSSNPPIHYLGLSTTNPLQTGEGITEPSASDGYERVAIHNNPTNWTTFEDGFLSNQIDFTFPTCINNNWNTLEQPLYIFLATSPTDKGDAIIYYTELINDDKKLIQTGTTLKISAGHFKLIELVCNG